MKPIGAFFLCRLSFLALLLAFVLAADAAAPVVSNVRASQRAGSKLVEIYYDLADADSATLSVSVAVSTDGGASYGLPATSFSGTGYGSAVAPGKNKLIFWDAGADWPGKFSSNVRFRVTADDAAVPTAPTGMALIPAGSFQMGDALDNDSDALPVHTVYVSAFYMDKYLVTKALWDGVYQWAIARGYKFDNAGSGKASTHPVQTIDWYDMVKWCNARSEKEGRVPAYYTSAAQTTVYRSGQVDVQIDWVKWNVGYRLPTEAEWEKAARGGLSGKRFPWGDTITHSQANYDSDASNAYDISPTRGYHPIYNDGVYPYTSPVGSFAANGYGLYDMAGNVWEGCWDWYGYGDYSSGAQINPRGPTSGSCRVIRGGFWYNSAWNCRSASRISYWPATGGNYIGFRSALPLGQ